jgi:glycosyltransferase involved in cell wall biosynthesis
MHVLIAGTRGIPARHGGFETFAQELSLYLLSQGHQVTVYCQEDSGEPSWEDEWHGVHRVHLNGGRGPLGTLKFDWATVRDSLRKKGVVLTLGYNTAILSLLYRCARIPNLFNMDGIEWKRKKWSRLERAWLWINEWVGARSANHLIADHPEIRKHLLRHTSAEKITMIPYGAETVFNAQVEQVRAYGLIPGSYYLLVARPEPENSICEIVRAYSMRIRRVPLVVLGAYSPESSSYQREVIKMAGPGVTFLGAIYDRSVLDALRFHACAYLHGHTVGGTNPSLVEALAAGSPVIAQDNPFNRWVAGSSAKFFQTTDDLAKIFDMLEEDSSRLFDMREGSRKQHRELFMQQEVLSAYEHLLLRFGA